MSLLAVTVKTSAAGFGEICKEDFTALSETPRFKLPLNLRIPSTPVGPSLKSPAQPVAALRNLTGPEPLSIVVQVRPRYIEILMIFVKSIYFRYNMQLILKFFW